MADRRLTVLVAPDSFKGTLSSVEVADALAEGWRAERPDDELLLSPLADGGEGTLAAIAAAGGWEMRTATVHDPLDQPIEATWLRAADGRRAVLEMARASGLSLIAPSARDPERATSRGTGELLGAAIADGVNAAILGIGGSATTDGGAGLLGALGVHDDGRVVDLSGIAGGLADLRLEVACDVTNPLLGPDGAAAVYGPQKGASPQEVERLDVRQAAWADRLEAATGRRERDTPGAGAAGGVGFALLCLQQRFRSFALRPGVDLVMEATGFDARLARADLVLTGEGRIDAQTAFGKTAMGVARRAHAAGVRCIAIGGSVEPAGAAALAAAGAEAEPVWDRPVSLETAMAAGRRPLVRAGKRLARTVSGDVIVSG